MKKVFSLLLVFVILTSIAVSASATDFVPSVSYTPCPDLVVLEEDAEGNEVIAYVVDAQGEVLSSEYKDSFLITPVHEAKNGESDLSEAAEQLLVETYKALTAEDAKLSALIPELNDIAKSALGDDATADNLVVCELFDITPNREEFANLISQDGTTITLTFKLDIPQNAFLTVMTLHDGKWEQVKDVKNNNNGTVTVTFNHFCPVLFLTEGTQSPEQGSASWLIAVAAVVVVAAAAVLFVVRRKRR